MPRRLWLWNFGMLGILFLGLGLVLGLNTWRSRAVSAEAELRRGRQAIVAGHLAAAEAAFVGALEKQGPEATDARDHLIHIVWRQARFDEVATLIEAQWADLRKSNRLSTPTAVDLLRGHLALDLEVFPAEEIVAGLRALQERFPDDDRVWLGLARWAIYQGKIADAKPLLDACLKRRPDDPAVWRGLLDWARASDRVDVVKRALAHLPVADDSPREVASLRAWLASTRGDDIAERAAIETLLTLDPGDLAAMDRLSELLVKAGSRQDAAKLRDRKAKLDHAKQRYQNLLKNDELTAKPGALAALAQTLDRRFENQAFLTLACRKDPGNPVLRKALRVVELSRTLPAGGSKEKPITTLADMLKTELGQIPEEPGGKSARLSAVPGFDEAAAASGLAFVFDSGATAAHQLPEVMSGGVALIDYDGDGRLDVFALQGGPFPPKPERPANGNRLFQNRGDGTFEDTTARSGLAHFQGGYAHGVAVGDYDNDGRSDLFVTRWRGYALYHNRGDGTFEDATERAGLAGDRDWPTSAAFADLDNDGDLDLYVCHYLKWDAERPRLCPSPSGKGYRSCDPRHFEALPDHIFRNDGGKFVDVTAETGFDDREGRGLGVSAGDLDGDGLVDLFVANDGSANYLLKNLGGFKFEEVGQAAGVACNAGGAFQAGMGTAIGDVDGDGLPDIVVTNFFGESTSFFRNLGQGMFSDRTSAIGLAAPSRSLLGFGVALFDANNDGHLDLATANGHVNDERPGFPFQMPAQLLIGGADGHLTDVSGEAGQSWIAPRIGRGLAVGDLDNDGRNDVLLVALDGPSAYFRNATAKAGGHFLTIGLEGDRSNKDGVGAVVTVHAGGVHQKGWRVGGGSYLSAGDPRLHFGLGNATRVESIEVRWPSGRIDRFTGLAADQGYRLREGSRAAEPLAGFGP